MRCGGFSSIGGATPDVGLFANIEKIDGGLAVSRLGVEDADIRGASGVGILAGLVSDASFSGVWTTGEVLGFRPKLAA